MSEPSLWSFIANAGPVVKTVMGILLMASLGSWSIIFQKLALIRNARKILKQFEKEYWQETDLSKLYIKMKLRRGKLQGPEQVFYSGFSDYFRLQKQPGIKSDDVIAGSSRSMGIALSKELALLEAHLAILATIGSTSPYVGLFGTVWGIMTSFRALSAVQQASISMVAPGISEALIATAIGLFAAIPAVVAYNYCSNEVDKLTGVYETYKEEFIAILHRQLLQPNN